MGEDVCLYHSSDRVQQPPLAGLQRPGSRHINAFLSRSCGNQLVYDLGLSSELIRRTADADVLHLHNLHGYYLDYPHLLRAWRDRPVVWTWHDFWPVTGRCGFPENDCSKWLNGCGECLSLKTYPSAWLDWSASDYQLKSELYQQMHKLLIVTPCEYLRQQAISRGFQPDRVQVIANPVALDKFKPQPQHEARQALGFSTTEPLLLFVAADCNDVRKGYADFERLVTELQVPAVVVGAPPSQRSPLIRYTGLITDSDLLNLYYAAADLLVMTTRADNYPNVTIEAMASGAAVLSYATGGIPDQMPDFWDGLVAAQNYSALAQRCQDILADRESLQALSGRFREHALDHWQPQHIARQYLQAYQRVLHPE
jgi:glycosyltransferase involved in cell wall biosynthesis